MSLLPSPSLPSILLLLLLSLHPLPLQLQTAGRRLTDPSLQFKCSEKEREQQAVILLLLYHRTYSCSQKPLPVGALMKKRPPVGALIKNRCQSELLSKTAASRSSYQKPLPVGALRCLWKLSVLLVPGSIGEEFCLSSPHVAVRGTRQWDIQCTLFTVNTSVKEIHDGGRKEFTDKFWEVPCTEIWWIPGLLHATSTEL